MPRTPGVSHRSSRSTVVSLVIAVHIAAQIMASAGPGEILTSRTVRDLVVGSDIALDDRGPQPLKGIEGTWQLFTMVGR